MWPFKPKPPGGPPYFREKRRPGKPPEPVALLDRVCIFGTPCLAYRSGAVASAVASEDYLRGCHHLTDDEARDRYPELHREAHARVKPDAAGR